MVLKKLLAAMKDRRKSRHRGRMTAAPILFMCVVAIVRN
jgi:hypothetical protein